MEDVVIKKPHTNASTKKWCDENVMHLANHFHELIEGQYKRVTHFTLNQSQIKDFGKIPEIVDVHIRMALDTEDKSNVTFIPFLSINLTNREIPDNPEKYTYEYEFELAPKTNGSFREEAQKLFSDEVPAIFRDMIWENWGAVEMHLIDDLFHCRDDQGFLKRVQCFIITANMVKLINEWNGQEGKSSIKHITLYPGIDMNKFNKPDKISFTPVLGIETKESYNIDGRLGLLEGNGNETLIEYSLPCPPTC